MGAKEMEKREKKEKGRGKREHYVRKTTPRECFLFYNMKYSMQKMQV
jgi:hypothetical protein